MIITENDARESPLKYIGICVFGISDGKNGMIILICFWMK